MCPVTQNEQDQIIRCVVAHDIAWLRQGVRRLLDDEPDITVVAEAEDAVQTLRDVFTHRPDIVVVDHHIFEGTAVQTERLIVRESPSSKVLFLTNHDEESRGEDLADSAYAVRRTSAEELVDMVRKTAAIECTASAQRTGRTSQNGPRPSAAAPRSDRARAGDFEAAGRRADGAIDREHPGTQLQPDGRRSLLCALAVHSIAAVLRTMSTSSSAGRPAHSISSIRQVVASRFFIVIRQE